MLRAVRSSIGGVIVVIVAACGGEAPAPASAPVANEVEQSEPSQLPTQTPEEPVVNRLELGPSPAQDLPPAPQVSSAQQKRDEMAAFMKAMQEAAEIQRDPNASAAEKQAAREKITELGIQMSRDSRNRQQRPLELPPEWAATHRVEKNAKEAELLVQVGDIDNLGFGWPEGFDPFSGESTPRHRFPWKPEADDPPGTDRIMVNTGMRDKRKARNRDGYTHQTERPDNLPQALAIEFDPKAVQVKAAVLQLFVDDFQAPYMNSRFSVTLDGKPAPDIETTINELNQTGPIGKLLTIQLLPEYLSLLLDGKLEIYMDDPSSNIGDGFAFDFARLLINPKGFTYAGAVRGVVVEKGSNTPIDGALVSTANVRQATTKADGQFLLNDVPAGLVVTTASHPDFITGSEPKDLLANQTIDVRIELERARNEDLAERLESEGKVDLYGIYFDTDKDVLKPQSEATLQQVLALLNSKPALRIAVAGHTDSQAGDAYNMDLSQRRAQAVVAWLTSKGIAADRLAPEGFGETQPVADNASPAGRALNRRVEIRDLSR